MTRVNIGMTMRRDVVLLLMFALILSACATAPQQGSVADPLPSDAVVIHSPQEQMSDFSRQRSQAILYVSVAYGEKRISGLVGESEYAAPHFPDLMRDRLIQALTTWGPFAAVYAYHPSMSVRSGSYYVGVIVSPYVDLAEPWRVAPNGVWNLFPLLGGSVDAKFNVNTITTIHVVSTSGNSQILRNSYDVSGLATSTIYGTRKSATQIWSRAIDASVPHLINVIARAALEQQPGVGQNRGVPQTNYQDTKPPSSTSQTGTSRRPAAKKPAPAPTRTPIPDDLGDLD
jgi:hypothetical protein